MHDARKQNDRFKGYEGWESLVRQALGSRLRGKQVLADELAAEAVFRVTKRILEEGISVRNTASYLRVTAARLIPRLAKARLCTVPLEEWHRTELASLNPDQNEIRADETEMGLNDRGRIIDALLANLDPRATAVLDAILKGYSVKKTAMHLKLQTGQVKRALTRIARKGRILVGKRTPPASS